MEIKLEDDDYINFLNDQKVNVNDDEIIDPVYKVFLDHLRKDGNSYIFEMVNWDNGLHTSVKYESEDELSEKNESGISFEAKENPEDKRWLKRRFSSKSGEADKAFPIPDIKFESPLGDDSYMAFLRHLKYKENYMILELDSVSIRYEDEREASVSSEILEPENDVNVDEKVLIPYTSTEASDLIVYEDGNSSIASMVNLECYELTDFKSKLEIILNKPYDEAEYEVLLKEATERKPVNKQKHLRSMSISYATKEVGLSYLDHFPDLEEQIMSAADAHGRLNLLRGFFFWLKNLSQGGAYMPWASSGYEVIANGDIEVVLPLDVARD